MALTALVVLSGRHALAFTPATLHAPAGVATSRLSSTSLASESAVDTDVSIEYDAAAKLAYDKWRGDFGKGDFDESRFDTFKANYEALTIANVVAAKKAREEGTTEDIQKLELNQFADMTAEEYMAANDGGEAAAAPEEVAEETSDVSIVYDSAARVAYDDWRAKFSKGDFDENKFVTFRENYEVVTVANVVAKKIARESKSDAPAPIELGEDADFVAVEVPDSTASILDAAMEGMAAQETAAAAISEAADALAEEEQVCTSQIIFSENVERRAFICYFSTGVLLII